MNDVLNATEVATILDCAAGTIEEKARTGELPAVKIGRSWIFPREALLKKLNELALANRGDTQAPMAIQKRAMPSGKGRRRSVPQLVVG